MLRFAPHQFTVKKSVVTVSRLLFPVNATTEGVAL